MADLPRHSDLDTLGLQLPHTAGKLRILIADDNRRNCAVIAKILERAGYKAEIVSDGEQALDALEAGSFDVVLMDINMPVMTGIEAAKLYRFISLGERRVPILALTVDATLETAARCAEAGMDGCVTKPVNPARLLEAINQVISCRETASQAAVAPPEQVTDIASHQRYRAVSQTTFDRGTLASFEALGGRSFLVGLIHDFIADSELLLTDLARAAEAGDIRLFRAQCYALQTAAAEVGAHALRDLQLVYRGLRRAGPEGREGSAKRPGNGLTYFGTTPIALSPCDMKPWSNGEQLDLAEPHEQTRRICNSAGMTYCCQPIREQHEAFLRLPKRSQ